MTKEQTRLHKELVNVERDLKYLYSFGKKPGPYAETSLQGWRRIILTRLLEVQLKEFIR